MGKNEKLFSKAANNPDGLRFDEFCTLMSRFGWSLDHQTGSHQIWYSSKGRRISVQNKSGKAKGSQVKQFLRCHNEETGNE